MKLKYKATHHVPFGKFLELKLKQYLHNLTSIGVGPVKTQIQPIFIVGAGHSGTTLIASKLGNSDACLLIGKESGAFLPEVGKHTSKKVIQEWLYFAQRANKQYLVEKTPKHVHVIKRIQSIVPHAKIIISIRNPLDNIASLYSRFGNLDFCIERWLMDNKPVLQYQDKQDTCLVKYEDLTYHPQHTFESICQLTGMPFDPCMLKQQQVNYDAVSASDNMQQRAWQVSKPIHPNTGKWRYHIDQSQGQKVVNHCKSLAQKLGYSHAFIEQLLKESPR